MDIFHLLLELSQELLLQVLQFLNGHHIKSFLYNLLYQIYDKSDKKVLLYSTSMEKLKKLDEYLWTAGKDSDFLPHSVFEKENKNDGRLLLSNSIINSNQADCLLLSSFVDNEDFLKSFKKVYYVFTKLNAESWKQAKSSFVLFEKIGCKIVVNEKGAGGNGWSVIDKI